MDVQTRREIILTHYQNPKNKGLIDDNTYIFQNMNNDSCIDEVNIIAKVVDDKIVDIKFDGEACAICTSSSSIMTDTLIGKTTKEALDIINNLYNMIEEKEYDENILGEACAYSDISKQPNRKKCVLLSWWGIEKILKKED